MDICNKCWRWFTPTNGINGITSSVPHLSLPGTFVFYFSISIISTALSNNTYHKFYDILFEIHKHQPFNRCLLFFGFVDKSFITMLMLQIILVVLVIIICVLFYFHIFYRIISISKWHIIFIITWIICTFRIIITCLVS